MLKLHAIQKSFDDTAVLRSISLSVAAGEIVALLGPSGCGKTTLLRIIAGLETADGGQVQLEGEDVTAVPVHQRGFGMVFQDYALFPHKNVFDNVIFGLRMQGWTTANMADRAEQVLALVGLAGFGGRAIHELSGGEQQRVALARALAPAPRLLLLDEPLGALDRALRERLMLDLRAILKQAGGLVGRPEGITAVYVTHDQAEAFAIADRIVVMNAGRVEQVGRPTDLYARPASHFVARFLGMENIVPAELLGDQPPRARTPLGPLVCTELPGSLFAGAAINLLIRPEAARFTTADDAGENVIHGRLADVSFRGRYQIATIVVTVGETAVSLKLEFDTSDTLPDIGQPASLRLNPQAIILLP
ncbi:MAG: ABC transporter ATP-binding protein [Chloroflexi bacterium]|nr:ABC transporter ATP-binding protein [Chloroflexota bacterium]MBP7041972.1 ABC transporter ATP-binding protein [Chloroflexota bacterium]